MDVVKSNIVELVELEGTSHRHSWGEVREADFDELLGVERSVPVSNNKLCQW